MITIAVTGGIACGKSLAGKILGEHGAAVCEADELAHEILRPGEPAFAEVVRAFGRGVLASDGTLDRRELGRRVFADPVERARLEALTHPAVRERWRGWRASRPRETRLAAVIVPLLYETGAEGEGWDAVLCVSAPEALQKRRLRDRGLTEQEAAERIAAQMNLGEKERRADYVVVNGGPVEILRAQMEKVLSEVMRK